MQGLDLHVQAAHEMLARFRFVPDARLDDLMLSYASDGGGVGPHLDSYDVFLMQVQGRRRWRIGRARDRALVEGVPLKILRHFEPEHEWLLEPGDMLYLPPLWAHDGVAVGECMTASVGFRAPGAAELARELLPRLAEAIEPADSARLYRDARQPATAAPGCIPPALQAFAAHALQRALRDPDGLDRALGRMLTEPKASVWFDAAVATRRSGQRAAARPAHAHDVRRRSTSTSTARRSCRRARREVDASAGRSARVSVPSKSPLGPAGARAGRPIGRRPVGCMEATDGTE